MIVSLNRDVSRVSTYNEQSNANAALKNERTHMKKEAAYGSNNNTPIYNSRHTLGSPPAISSRIIYIVIYLADDTRVVARESRRESKMAEEQNILV